MTCKKVGHTPQKIMTYHFEKKDEIPVYYLLSADISKWDKFL